MSGHRNPYETRCARDLGDGWKYEAIRLPYVIEQHYVPDFVDRQNKRIVEAKGRFPASDRKKMMAVKAAHPEYTYEIWFTNPDALINKGSKTTNRAWQRSMNSSRKPTPVRSSFINFDTWRYLLSTAAGALFHRCGLQVFFG